MGTRHLTAVKSNGEFKIAQYGQWDGYPEGQGDTIIEFLTSDISLESFKEKLENLEWITEEEHKQRWVEMGADPDSDLVSMDISSKFREKYPELHRDIGAEILQRVYDKDGELKLKNDVNFASDSLFCEWAYLIDMDSMKLIVSRGFQKVEHEANVFGVEMSEDNGYYPVKAIVKFDLTKPNLRKRWNQWLKEYNEE